MLCFKRINNGLEVGVYHPSTSLHHWSPPGNADWAQEKHPLPPLAQGRKTIFSYCALLQRENPVRLKKNNILIYLLGRYLCPVPPVGAAAAADRHCVAVPPLAGSPVCRGKRGVGRSVGRICAYVRLLGEPMQAVTAGRSAEIPTCSALCTKGWSRWGVTRAAAAAAAAS